MKRLEENLPHLGSGSAARIEVLAQLAAAGGTNINDLEAMGGGGDDPLEEYFKKAEGASPDWINNLFQWIEQEEQKGTRTVNHQGIALPLNNFKSRLEEIRARKQQIVSEVPTTIADTGMAFSLRSLIDEVQTLRSAREVELQTKKKKEQLERLAQLIPEAIAGQLESFRAATPELAEGVSLLMRLNVPGSMSKVAAYLMGDESDTGVGEIQNLPTDRGFEFYQLFGRKVGTIKGIPELSFKKLGLNIVHPTPAHPIEGINIGIQQTRIPRYVVERCADDLGYPKGDEFWRYEDKLDFTVDVWAGKIDGKLAISIKSSGSEEPGGNILFQPDEADLKKSLVNILAGLKE